MSEQIWGQLILTVATGAVSIITTIVGLFVWRSRENLKIALREAEARAKDAEARAQERVIKAENDFREGIDFAAIMTRLIEHIGEISRRASENDARHRADDDRKQEALMQLLAASHAGTESLKTLVLDMASVKTDLGENIRVLRLLEQAVSGLPTQLDTRTNPLIDAFKDLAQRVDKLVDGFPIAKDQLLAEIIAAIREALLQIQNQSIPPTLPNEGT
jgi:hypothetical protein